MIYPNVYDTSVTSNTDLWDTQVAVSSSSNVVITGTVPTDMTAIPVSGSFVVCYSPSDAALLELPKRSTKTPAPGIPVWRVKLQKVIPFFAPRPEFHARSNPQRR